MRRVQRGKQQRKAAAAVALRMPKDPLSPADTRNFLHWVRINSSEKPSDDA